jgi:porphobilinogen synthase|tara:strand:+ start:975 stop:1937 length:963 start_codon:yes stop_codon:yes gene_type:complete
MPERLRGLRKNQEMRDRVSETSLSSEDFIYPVFVKEGIDRKESILSLAGQFRYSLNDVDGIVKECEKAKLKGILLFGIPEKKDDVGSEAWNDDGIVQQAIRKIKKRAGLLVFADVCLCQYTSHGHCGVLKDDSIDNDSSLELLNKIAVSYAKAGVDFVCPSAMMDFQVKSIRKALDEGGFSNMKVMSYSAKFNSNFYGPFRDAVDSAPRKWPKDRKTYQMDFRNGGEAIKEIELDISEGADIVMVKPALAYLDIIAKAKEKFGDNVKVAAYNVSGEYAMLKNSGIDILYESLIGIKRAGADIIISYGALEILDHLNKTRR